MNAVSSMLALTFVLSPSRPVGRLCRVLGVALVVPV